MRRGAVATVVLIPLLLVALGGAKKLRARYKSARIEASAMAATRDPAAVWRPKPLQIPHEHPRLWWNAERLARARVWAKGRDLHPRDDDPAGQALSYLLNGDRAMGRRAVDWLMKFTFTTEGVASDPARWYGESAFLVFDWCHDLLSEDQLKTIIARWNGYLEALDQKQWGGIGMEGNNYYWGYLRNDIEWGIASAYENPKANERLRYGLERRFGQSFAPYAARAGRGGVLPEGSQYGPYLVAYATVPFVSVANAGDDLWDATPFFREVVFYLIHATTPAATASVYRRERLFELFPFNDDEKFRDDPGPPTKPHLATFMLAASERWRDEAVGQYAQAWLDLVKPTLPDIALAWRGTAGHARGLSQLPLDYFAPGIGFFFTRDAWGPGAMVVQMQLGRPANVGHEHIDWGTFQIWRGGRWLTRETVGYENTIAGWQGDGTAVPTSSAIAHNGFLFEGMGPRSVGDRRGPPVVKRLESRPEYSYAAVELGDSYRCMEGCGRPQRDENPYVAGLTREMVFVRRLQAFVVLDRAAASGEAKRAESVVKTFVFHAEAPPKPAPSGLIVPLGDQTLRFWNLLPAGAVPRIVAEGGPVGQQRVEIDAKGQALSHLLNVFQGRGSDERDLQVSARETDSEIVVTISDPDKGTAVVTFAKGPSSKGGKFGFATRGSEPALAPLIEKVQRIDVTPGGPVWR